MHFTTLLTASLAASAMATQSVPVSNPHRRVKKVTRRAPPHREPLSLGKRQSFSYLTPQTQSKYVLSLLTHEGANPSQSSLSTVLAFLKSTSTLASPMLAHCPSMATVQTKISSSSGSSRPPTQLRQTKSQSGSMAARAAAQWMAYSRSMGRSFGKAVLMRLNATRSHGPT